MSVNPCAQHSCSCPGSLGLGWGLSTRLVEWYCPQHFGAALNRLARLLEVTFGSAAATRNRQTVA
jgi:hypothetical protein